MDLASSDHFGSGAFSGSLPDTGLKEKLGISWASVGHAYICRGKLPNEPTHTFVKMFIKLAVYQSIFFQNYTTSNVLLTYVLTPNGGLLQELKRFSGHCSLDTCETVCSPRHLASSDH